MIVGSFRKKLLVLDVNGLLVDIVADPDEAHKPDIVIASKAVFKRPFCDDFLKFCFQRFDVGVWTSRTSKNLNRVLDFLMWDTRHQLLFSWDQTHCTDTGSTIENTGKPLLLKELKKLWEKQDPNLPWDRGAYDESNTLLLDDSPYKALRNPPHTAIFPYTYSYRNAHDNDLGPNGDLRNYLERLAASDNIQKYIEQNPFGQQPITHDNESWNFYQKIICSTQPGAGPSRSAAYTLEEQETGTTTALVAPTILEPKPDSSTTPTLLEPKTNSAATSAAHTLVEVETGSATAFLGQTLLEPDLNTTALAAQTSLEQEAVSTVLTAPILLEPEIGTTTALVGQTLPEAGIGSKAVAAQTSLESETMTTGHHYYLILENLEKNLCSLSMMNFIQEQTSITAQACVFPSLLSETYARGAILVDSKTELQILYEFIENPNHFIISLSGRPWIIAEDRLTRTGIFNPTNLHSFWPKYENFGTKKDLKVVALGTEGYTIAKQLKDLYVEFRNHCNGLVQRLAIEEKKLDVS